MPDKPKYIYIMYPIPIEEAEKLSLPLLNPADKEPQEDFVPLWFGNARFPEDE